VPDGVAGVAQLHALVADHAEEPSQVIVGIELDRGLLVGALTAAGYQVVAVNPLQASRYRERHAVSGAKSDPGDAKVLADLVRTDRHNHRLVAGDSELAEAIRVLGEFGDDQTRFPTAKSRKNYAGSAPITKASGRSLVVLARHARNRRLADALEQWAFCSLTHSPGARRYYDQLRARNKTHRQALRQLANRWVGILHTCLERDVVYDEHLAWSHLQPTAA
jgi:transposase